jgi:hypothetical protein
MEYELVPPGCNCCNAAEVAIRNFKAHFFSVLAGVSNDFPLNLWDKLLPQTKITLNLLRQSNATPTISAHAHLNGPFEYNKMPLVPMGCTRRLIRKEHGPFTLSTVGTSTLHPNITVLIAVTSKTQRVTDLVTPSTSNTNESPIQPSRMLIK